MIPGPKIIKLTGESFPFCTKVHFKLTPSITPEQAHFIGGEFTKYCEKLFKGCPVDPRDEMNINLILAPAGIPVPPGHYFLIIKPSDITLASETYEGLLYAWQTLKQHLYNTAYYTETGTDIECLQIADWPSFPWRGLHLDVSRHFFDYKFARRYLDWMAVLKLNKFHWHLSDDQGWRIESKRFPRLHEIGAWRVDQDGSRYGGYYTQRQIKLVLKHAQERGIEVIPEIDVPGHAMAILASYPDLACFPRDFQTLNVWGISEDILCAGKDSVLTFLKDLFSEVAELFGGQYIHLGGDEAPKARWKECPHCQQRIIAENLANEEELQGWLVDKLAKHLQGLGKTVIGWDEILDGNIDDKPVVMAWRGDGIEAARKAHDNGNRYIICPNNKLYFDWKSSDSPRDPGAHGITTLEDVYNLDLGQYSFANDDLFLGGQANLWTENISSPKIAKEMLGWRVFALAELFWSDPLTKNFTEFWDRTWAMGSIF